MRTIRLGSCPALLVAMLFAACSSSSDHAPRHDTTPDAPSADAPGTPVTHDARLPDAPATGTLDAGDCVLGTAWPFGSAMCTACVQDHCCEQVNACENSQECNDYVMCRYGCALAGQTCINNCNAMYPAQVPVYDAFTMCIANSNCQSVCQ